MLAQQQEVEADVRKEDQIRINEFGRNNAALHEIRDQKKSLQDKLDTLDDANTELMMGEGDNVELFIGESFVEASEEFAQEYIEKIVEALKKVLYSRFGQSINLEDS
ncbi:Prefoldin family protein, partial [Globisporangium splendens]